MNTANEQIELIRKWVTALRSGEYEQGQGLLRSVDNKFCCLGVLCEISGLGEWEEHVIENSQRRCYRYVTGAGGEPNLSIEFLPLAVGAAIGHGEKDLSVHDTPEHPRNLTDLNDNGLSFDEIADLIELEYLR